MTYDADEFRKIAEDVFALDAGSMRDRARIIQGYLKPAYALRAAVEEAERLRALLSQPKPLRWLADCAVCHAAFEHTGTPSKCGHFCPNCKEKGYFMLGVLNFQQK